MSVNAIRGTSSQIFRLLTNTNQRIIQRAPYLKQGGEILFKLPVLELALFLPLLYSYLYKQGQDKNKLVPGATGDWTPLQAMMEAGVTYGMVQHTKNLFPAVGLGWAVYEVGAAKTPLEKQQALLKAAVLFSMGFAGIRAGQVLSDVYRQFDANNIQKLLKTPALAKLMNLQVRPNIPNPTMREEISLLLKELSDKTTRFSTFFKGKNPKAAEEGLRVVTRELAEAQAKFLNQIAKYKPAQLKTLGTPFSTAMTRLTQSVGRSQTANAIRLFNPMFGYLLGISLLGVPLLKLAADTILPKGKPIRTRDWYEVGPMWFHRVFGQGQHVEPIEERFPILKANGPALLKEASAGQH